jgi:hypothetical protein
MIQPVESLEITILRDNGTRLVGNFVLAKVSGQRRSGLKGNHHILGHICCGLPR